jgi:hypothetical protein
MTDRSDLGSNAPSSVPSYAQPNLASRLPDYTNQTQEAIRAAFQPNNFRTIQSLHGHDVDNGPFRVGKTGATTFSDFTYVSSPYDLGEEARVRERLEHEDRARHVGGDQPFFAGYSCTKAKHEMDFDFEYMVDPYDEAENAQRADRIDSESKRVARPFLPAGVQKALAKPTRAMLGDAMSALYRTISDDWSEAPPTVLSTAEDLIVVYFSLEKVKNDAGVLTYMNNALRRNEAILEYGLQKVLGAWHRRTNDGHLMYTFRPPWVRIAISIPADESSAATSPGQDRPAPASSGKSAA